MLKLNLILLLLIGLFGLSCMNKNHHNNDIENAVLCCLNQIMLDREFPTNFTYGLNYIAILDSSDNWQDSVTTVDGKKAFSDLELAKFDLKLEQLEILSIAYKSRELIKLDNDNFLDSLKVLGSTNKRSFTYISNIRKYKNEYHITIGIGGNAKSMILCYYIVKIENKKCTIIDSQCAIS